MPVLPGTGKSLYRRATGFPGKQNALSIKLSAAQREAYKTIGGTPHLDRNYTVYGEVIKGIDMIDKIAAVVTAAGDRPVADVKMTVTVLKKRAAKKLEKRLRKSA